MPKIHLITLYIRYRKFAINIFTFRQKNVMIKCSMKLKGAVWNSPCKGVDRMKAYTDVLINKVEGGHKWYRPDPDLPVMHYEAKHKTENIYIMWMETRMMRRRCALPCILIEDGDPMVFKPSKSIGAGQENAAMLKRWALLVTPQNIDTEWIVAEVEKDVFAERYKKAQDGSLFANLTPAGSSDAEDDSAYELEESYEEAEEAEEAEESPEQ